jgi:hypothetical protein
LFVCLFAYRCFSKSCGLRPVSKQLYWIMEFNQQQNINRKLNGRHEGINCPCIYMEDLNSGA